MKNKDNINKPFFFLHIFLGEVIAVVGSCEALGNWSYQKAVTLKPLGDEG